MSARSLNKAMLIGNLTRDPEVRYTPSQVMVCTFGLATNREWTAENGEKQSSVDYHNLVAWRKMAEICQNLLRKGSKVYVEGRLQTRDWQTQDGQPRQRTEIVIENMILLTPKSASNVAAYAANEPPAMEEAATVAEAVSVAAQPAESAQVEEIAVDDESDIPF